MFFFPISALSVLGHIMFAAHSSGSREPNSLGCYLEAGESLFCVEIADKLTPFSDIWGC